MGGYRRHNTILLTLIGIWFCLITFGNSEGSNLLRQLKGRSKLKKAKSTVFSSSLKGKDNAYFKAMLKKKQATSHPTTEVEPQPEGDHDEHGHEPDTVREEEEHLDHGGYGHEDNVEEEEEEEEKEEEEEEEEEEEYTRREERLIFTYDKEKRTKKVEERTNMISSVSHSSLVDLPEIDETKRTNDALLSEKRKRHVSARSVRNRAPRFCLSLSLSSYIDRDRRGFFS